MNISVLGDSISTLDGYNPPGFLAYYSPYEIPLNETWWMRVINALDGDLLINNSFSGSTAASASPVVETFPSGGSDGRILLGENPNMILVYLGINDLVYGIPLEGSSLDHFEGGYANMIQRLQTRYPDAEIVAIAPAYNQKQKQIIEQIAEKKGIHVIPLEKMVETRDGFHPTRLGMKQLADQILESLVMEQLKARK